jgi:hypothetical protein
MHQTRTYSSPDVRQDGTQLLYSVLGLPACIALQYGVAIEPHLTGTRRYQYVIA